MKSHEFLKAAADFFGGNSAETTQPTQPNRAVLTPAYPELEDKTEDVGIFVSPLQAKLELLKKAVNVDSIYDEEGSDEDLTGYGADNEDELDQIKKLSGISVVAVDEAGSDEPLDV